MPKFESPTLNDVAKIERTNIQIYKYPVELRLYLFFFFYLGAENRKYVRLSSDWQCAY